jgi:superfamily II DNA/RNA helicase
VLDDRALGGRDVVAMARTGSGKTAAFLIPMVERLAAHSARIGARAVVLSPTRELVLQTLRFARALAKFTDLRFAALTLFHSTFFVRILVGTTSRHHSHNGQYNKKFFHIISSLMGLWLTY